MGALQRVARGEGLIRLGLLRTLGVDFVPGLVARYLRENPGWNLRFTFHTGVTQQLLEGLLESNSTWRSAPSLRRRFNSQPFLRAVRMWS